ncbi:MAG: hypothetical protein AAF739_15970 [Pseudomonadota bacterium]
MNRLKHAALTVASLVLAAAAFAFFASVGLAVVGVLAFVALLGGLAAFIATASAAKQTTIDV